MYLSSWVYIIEQVNLYGISTKQIALKKTTIYKCGYLP